MTEILENGLKQGSTGNGELRQFCAAWQATARTLDSLQAEAPVIQSDNAFSLDDKLVQLQKLLADDKLVPAELLDDLPARFSASQSETVHRLLKAIGSYDYPKALQLLKALQ
jgi:hypothetical protein